MNNSSGWQIQMAARMALAGRHPNDLARWSEANRSFDATPMTVGPQLRPIYEDRHPEIVIQKAAQIGISEYLLNHAFWVAATAWGGRGNSIYYLPTQVMADDFSQARANRAISDSVFLSSLVHERRGLRGAQRRDLRRIGPGHVYFRGADTDRAFLSIDADLVVLDEFDRMRDGALERSRARLGSAAEPLLRVASTPTRPNLGINLLFQLGDQRRWMVRCSRCRTVQHRIWAENVDFKTLRLICRKCGRNLPWDLPGEWEPFVPAQGALHTYHLSKLDSPHVDLARCLAASRSDNPVVVEEFHNSDLGEPYQEPGTGLTIADLDACRGDAAVPNAIVMMGVDVGRRFHHVVIREFDRYRGTSSPLLITKIRSLDEVRPLMEQFAVKYCVVDSQPEFQKVQEIKLGYHRRIYSAFYDRPSARHTIDKPEREMHLNRTQILDQVYEGFRKRRFRLPQDARFLGGDVRDGIGEYYRQLLAPQRIVTLNSSRDWVAHYDEGNRPDHYAHAEAYCLAAFVVRFRRGRLGIL